MAMPLDEYKYAYYQTLRLEARSAVVKALNRRAKEQTDRSTWSGLSLASISSEAIEYSRIEWPKNYSGDTYQALPFSWEHLFYSYLRSPAHFNIAVWQTVGEEKILRGMALGRPSKAMRHLSLNWIERARASPSFKGGILLPILASAEQYAKLIGCERILVKNPVDPAEFAQYGYTPSDLAPKGATYLGKEI